MSKPINIVVLRLVKAKGTANLKEQLKAGALANAKLNLELAEEWFPVEQEASQRIEREEQATAKPRYRLSSDTARFDSSEE
jgi:hypothetical protein